MAVQLGGHLVAINDAEENAWLLETFRDYIEGSWGIWIGLNDIQSEGQWVWSSGELVSYTNWGGSEPNNLGGEDVASLYGYGGWNDLNGNRYSIYGIVEMSKPTSFLFFLSFFLF